MVTDEDGIINVKYTTMSAMTTIVKPPDTLPLTPSHMTFTLKHSPSQLSEIADALELEFNDISLLETALVHSSYVAEFPGVFAESNERLEFLGDAVLDLVVAQELVDRFPDRPEGHLTQMRAYIVDRDSLGRIGGRLGMGGWLLMGKGEVEHRGADRVSSVADALEALIAALFLDQGYEAARAFVLRVVGLELDEVADLEDPPRHPKSLLHEAAMERRLSPPVYEVLCQTGEDHEPTFTVQALMDGSPVGRGVGGSRRKAEAQAAEQALGEIES